MNEIAEQYGEPSILTVTKASRMAGPCYENAGLMPHQEGVRQRSPVRHKMLGSIANSMAGPGEARPVGDRVSAWMGSCSQGPSILERLLTHIDVLYHEQANKREREGCLHLS